MKLYEDMTDHINDALKAIDRWEKDQDTLQALEGVRLALVPYTLLDHEPFLRAVHKQLAANNPSRARKLIGVLDDCHPTWPMMLILGGWRFVKWGVKRLAVVAVVVAACLVIAYALGWVG